MIQVSVATVLAIIAVLVTLGVASVKALLKLSDMLGAVRTSLENLTKAVEKLEGLPERVAVLEERTKRDHDAAA